MLKKATGVDTGIPVRPCIQETSTLVVVGRALQLSLFSYRSVAHRRCFIRSWQLGRCVRWKATLPTDLMCVGGGWLAFMYSFA